MATKYYPVSRWLNTNSLVRFGLVFDTAEAAIAHADTSATVYGDHRFTGHVVQLEDGNCNTLHALAFEQHATADERDYEALMAKKAARRAARKAK